MGIKLKELLPWLESNSILDLEDNIKQITVDEKKEKVIVTGYCFDCNEEKIISFSMPFDAIKTPVKASFSGRGDTENRRTRLYDDEIEESPSLFDNIKEEVKIQLSESEEKRDKEDEQIRDSEHKRTEEVKLDGTDEISKDKA